MRRVDRQTNALPARPTDQPTNQPTDTASYRGALSHLKHIAKSLIIRKLDDDALEFYPTSVNQKYHSKKTGGQEKSLRKKITEEFSCLNFIME